MKSKVPLFMHFHLELYVFTEYSMIEHNVQLQQKLFLGFWHQQEKAIFNSYIENIIIYLSFYTAIFQPFLRLRETLFLA